MSTSLAIDRISKHYDGGVVAVSGLSLDVDPGEFVTLLGPSGSGKTTLLKMIAGFEAPSGGDIRLGGRSIINLPSHRRGIGMVFQNYALFPHMTVYENVEFPLSVRDMPRRVAQEKIAAALRIVHLEGLETRYPAQLSGGQQQRVALARAVVFDPSLLLMDEPLGALDRNLREQMKIEIKRVQRALEMTVIYVTHDQDEALALSDRVAVMRDGRLEQVATARVLYDQPRTSFVARFIGESNLLRCVASPLREGRHEFLLADGTQIGRGVAPAAGEVSVLIRPEKISLLADGEETRAASLAGLGAVVLHGRLSEVTFLGEALRCRVAAGAVELTVKLQNRTARSFAIGDSVVLAWKPDDVVVLGE